METQLFNLIPTFNANYGEDWFVKGKAQRYFRLYLREKSGIKSAQWGLFIENLISPTHISPNFTSIELQPTDNRVKFSDVHLIPGDHFEWDFVSAVVIH